MSKAVKVIAVIVFLILLGIAGLGIYFAYKYSDGFKTTPKSFYLEINGKRYFENTDGLTLGDVQIDVRYAFDELTKKSGYTYKVKPAGEDFAYLVDGSPYNYLGIEDLSAGFNIACDDFGLTLKCKNKKVKDVLQQLYPGQEVTVPSSEENGCRYKLVVISVDGEQEIALTFQCAFDIDGIELDKPSIVF